MKRFFLYSLSVILLLAAIAPSVTLADASHTMEADRVLIYNPFPYDSLRNKLYTGTLPTNAEDEDTSGKALFRPGLHHTGKDCTRETKDTTTHYFWVCTNLNTYTYDKLTFRLAGEGAHCTVWSPLDNDAVVFTDEQIAAMVEQFETVIYPSDTEWFGPFRDLGGDGKLNIVTYDMRSFSVCGFFDVYDLYTAEEIAIIDPDDAESYNCLPIINVNTRMADNNEIIFGTLAHEFQHLILQSAVLSSPANNDLLGHELSPGVWLNEAFSMEAEELAYPDSVGAQGYITAYNHSQKVAQGMSLMNFDAVSSDVGAYGQSYLFAEYLKAQCGQGVFRSVLNNWRTQEDAALLTAAEAIKAQLNDKQKEDIALLADYTATTAEALGSDANLLLSKMNLAYRLAILIQAEEGIFALGKEMPITPVYSGTGRRIEGGGAVLIETDGSFTVPADADSGMIFVAMKDGAITETYVVPEPKEGFYVLAAQYDNKWLAIPAQPADSGILNTIELPAPVDGVYQAKDVENAVFTVSRENGGYRLMCDDALGTYALTRSAHNQQNLSVETDGTAFAWSHFADGKDRLQADGYTGRAILYGAYQHGFGYFASAYFENASFAKLQLIPVHFKIGDANLDGRITAADAALILRNVVKLVRFDAVKRAAADLDSDGTVSAIDAAFVLRIVIGLEEEPED